MNLRVKGSNAILATADFYAQALAGAEAEIAQKDAALTVAVKAASECKHPGELTLEGTGAGTRVVCETCGKAWGARRK